VTKLKTTRSL